MRFRLRTLMILMAVVPPAIAAIYGIPELAALLLLVLTVVAFTGVRVYRTVEYMLTAKADSIGESVDGELLD
jgi:hypothetical protein